MQKKNVECPNVDESLKLAKKNSEFIKNLMNQSTENYSKYIGLYRACLNLEWIISTKTKPPAPFTRSVKEEQV